MNWVNEWDLVNTASNTGILINWTYEIVCFDWKEGGKANKVA